MSFPIGQLKRGQFPPLLHEIPQVPQKLYYRGALPAADLKLLSVVGSRRYSSYGAQVVEHLIAGLAGYNIGIVSGLALGIDSLAHKAALDNSLYTLAIPGSGIAENVLYPARHRGLAQQILQHNGGLLSEFEPDFTATKWSFAQRNRIMAGISHATILIEAAERSGTLITARLASDYNRELLVVPGNIFSSNTAGVHQFLKLGATPVTNAHDILYALRIDPDIKPAQTATTAGLSDEEQRILRTLSGPMDTDTLIRQSGIATHKANALLMQMEMRGLIAQKQGTYISRIDSV